MLFFYNKRRRELRSKNIRPNKAHYSLVELESKFTVNIVTQNISGLQIRAGSKSVIELHGSLTRSKCFKNNHVHSGMMILAVQIYVQHAILK